jgi:Zn-finger nucleic acid-binding protein
MKCPNCQVNLVMTDRSGIEIDYCPECRGVWLDRGELDKIIERSAPAAAPVAPPPAARPAPQERSYHDRDDRRDYDRDDYKYKKKPKSLLGDIFDF